MKFSIFTEIEPFLKECYHRKLTFFKKYNLKNVKFGVQKYLYKYIFKNEKITVCKTCCEINYYFVSIKLEKYWNCRYTENTFK